MNIHNQIIDLLPIFRNQYYYVKEIGDGASIKQVLPALFPDDGRSSYVWTVPIYVNTEPRELTALETALSTYSLVAIVAESFVFRREDKKMSYMRMKCYTIK